ncbi:MAG: hypothetical protein SF162_03475 [bacterium]|nr:hypothetical protein [bacterium]
MSLLAVTILSTGSLAGNAWQQSEPCPALVQQALDQLNAVCSRTGRNQICYANLRIDAEPQSDIRDFSFELGDIAPIRTIASLELSPLDPLRGEWGVALLRAQASLPASLPGQNVSFLLFGDVTLTPETVVNENGFPAYGRAFQLETRVGRTTCAETPTDGLLVQTPDSDQRVALTINDVNLILGSTVLFQAVPNQAMTITTLEGGALAETDDGISFAPAGSFIEIPLNADNQPSGAPSIPQTFDAAAVENLPVEGLPDEVVIAEPAPAEVLEIFYTETIETLPEKADEAYDVLDILWQDTVGDSTPSGDTKPDDARSTGTPGRPSSDDDTGSGNFPGSGNGITPTPFDRDDRVTVTPTTDSPPILILPTITFEPPILIFPTDTPPAEIKPTDTPPPTDDTSLALPTLDVAIVPTFDANVRIEPSPPPIIS